MNSRTGTCFFFGSELSQCSAAAGSTADHWTARRPRRRSILLVGRNKYICAPVSGTLRKPVKQICPGIALGGWSAGFSPPDRWWGAAHRDIRPIRPIRPLARRRLNALTRSLAAGRMPAPPWSGHPARISNTLFHFPETRQFSDSCLLSQRLLSIDEITARLRP